jgi:antitoxin HigA-1
MKKFSPIHPGMMLEEDLLTEKNISQVQLAKDIKLPVQQIREVCAGKKPITPNLSLRLGIYFGMSPNFWLNLQNDYEQECLKDILESQESKIKKQITPLTKNSSTTRRVSLSSKSFNGRLKKHL